MTSKYLIGDVAKMLDISAETIRFYEKEGLIAPQKDEKNNYRYYSINDITQLNDILFLRELGLGIKDIKETLGGTNSKDLRLFCQKKRQEIEKGIRHQTMLLHRLTGIERTNQVVERSLGIYTIKAFPSFYILGQYTLQNLLAQSKQATLDITQLTCLCALGGILRPQKTTWNVEREYLFISRRTAIDYNVASSFPKKELVESKRCAHTVVKPDDTANSLLKEADHLNAWLDMTGNKAEGTIYFNHLTTATVAGLATNYIELWAPLAQQQKHSEPT